MSKELVKKILMHIKWHNATRGKKICPNFIRLPSTDLPGQAKAL